jgi:Rab-GTPase-TBC domain-containing protein
VFWFGKFENQLWATALLITYSLMEDYDLRACFLPDLSGLHLRIYQFNRLLRQHVPKVATHLENLGVEGEYLSQWFLSIFAVTCPLPLLFRIYDVVFAEGASETIMRVALSIMKINERKIVNYADFDDVMQLLLSRQLWDVYGLNPASADEFVMDFVSFTSLVTRESLDALEGNFKEAQGAAGGRSSFLPNVSSAASRFLGRLWSSPPKQQGLSPSHVHTNSTSRPTSTLLRTPSKQSLSTISSMEATSDFSTGTQSTAQTEVSTNSRENSINSEFVRSIKSTESVQPPFNRTPTQSTKEKELDGQIEDLLMMLSEMQKNQALLQAQLQKVQEDRSEDNVVIRAFVDQVKADISEHKEKKVTSHRRVASEVGNVLDMSASRPTMSPTTVRLLGSLDQRIRTRHVRSSSSLESKADLRASLASVKEQLYVETTRSQELSRQLDAKDQESASLRDELQKARSRIKDAHFDKQRLEKTVLELRAAQKQSALSRSNSKSSITDDDQGNPEKRESSDSATKSGGLREFRLGRGGSGLSRNNTNAPTQIFSKRTSSLAHSTSTTTNLVSEPLAIPNALPIRHGATASVPNAPMSASAPPENDSLLLELVNAKTAEAVARQELDELKARFEAMRKMVTAVPVPVASSPSPPVQQSAFTPPALSTSSTASSMGENITKQHQASASVSAVTTAAATTTVSSGFGFFGWGKR